MVCEPDEDEDFDPYNLTIVIVIENDQVISIEVSGDGDSSNDKYIQWAVSGRSSYAGVVDQILALEELSAEAIDEVDVVTKATCSSISIKDACIEALALAASGSAEDGDTTQTYGIAIAATVEGFFVGITEESGDEEISD